MLGFGAGRPGGVGAVGGHSGCRGAGIVGPGGVFGIWVSDVDLRSRGGVLWRCLEMAMSGPEPGAWDIRGECSDRRMGQGGFWGWWGDGLDGCWLLDIAAF